MNKSHLQKRPRSTAVDRILGRKFRILDDGFVRVVDYMGNDESVVQAARVSYGKGTKQISQDRSLIRYLMRNRHTTPFEMAEIKFHIRAPMDCWRQWIRHRTANVNEYSTRYSVAIDKAQETPVEGWRIQSSKNKQGSQGYLPKKTGTKLSKEEARLHKLSRAIYEQRLNAGVAREQARKDLPLATYTEAYWKIDLHNLLHFLSLRMDAHAQAEIRSYANVIGEKIVKAWCPLTWEAFEDYRFAAMGLSKMEVEFFSALMDGDVKKSLKIGRINRWVNEDLTANPRSRERVEVESKLRRLGVSLPWKSADPCK